MSKGPPIRNSSYNFTELHETLLKSTSKLLSDLRYLLSLDPKSDEFTQHKSTIVEDSSKFSTNVDNLVGSPSYKKNFLTPRFRKEAEDQKNVLVSSAITIHNKIETLLKPDKPTSRELKQHFNEVLPSIQPFMDAMLYLKKIENDMHTIFDRIHHRVIVPVIKESELSKIITIQKNVRRWIIRRKFFSLIKATKNHGLLSRRRNQVLQEILTTEDNYVKGLELLLEGYAKPLKQSSKEVISQTNLQELLFNIDMIYNVSLNLLKDLTTRVKTENSDLVGDIFIKTGPLLKLYTGYINHYDRTTEIMIECRKSEAFCHFMSESMSKMNTTQTMEAILITPVQRVPRYELLVKELLKSTEDKHPDHPNLKTALTVIHDAGIYINKKKQEADTRNKVLQIQESFDKLPVDLISPTRYLLLEADLKVFAVGSSLGSPKQMKVVVMNDFVLLGSEKQLKNQIVGVAKFFSQSTKSIVNLKNQLNSLNFVDLIWIRGSDFKIEVDNSFWMLVITRSDSDRGWKFNLESELEAKRWLSMLNNQVESFKILDELHQTIQTMQTTKETVFYRDSSTGASISCLSVTSFTPIWDDRGTGAQPYKLTIWRPNPPPGFFLLGDHAERIYQSQPSMLVHAIKEVPSDSNDKPLLVPPENYVLVWKYEGAHECSIWEPIPPPNYVSLGHFATSDSSPPPRELIRCVRADVVVPAEPAPLGKEGYLWCYHKIFTLTKTVSLWQVQKKNGDKIALSTFIAVSDKSPPKAELFCFRDT